MALKQKIASWLMKGTKLADTASPAKSAKFSFVSGKRSRLSGSWRGGTNINTDIRNYKKNVNDIADEAIKNDNLAHGFMLNRRSKIVGSKGFILNVQSKKEDGTLDDEANQEIENKFKEWSKKEYCTVTGMQTFWQFQIMSNIMFKKTGESIIRFIENPAINKFGFALQPLHSDDLDHTFNTTLSNGNDVIMGVEVDKWAAPVAYWFKERNLWGAQQNKLLKRIPAYEINVIYDPIDIKQRRGISDYNQSIGALNNLADWKGALLRKAKSRSNNLAWLYKTDEEAQDFTATDGDASSTHTKEDGTTEELPIWDEEEAMYRFAPDGYKVQDMDTNFPSDAHESFDKTTKRDIATGLGETYFGLFNDLSDANFSSMREGKNNATDNYTIEQQITIDGQLTTIYERWLKNALLNGALNLEYANIDKYKEHFWQPRTYPWVDPWKDFQTVKGEYDLGVKTKTQICRERYGKDYRDVLKELAQELQYEKEIEDQYGIKFNSGVAAAPPPVDNTDGNQDGNNNNGNNNNGNNANGNSNNNNSGKKQNQNNGKAKLNFLN